MMPRVPGAKDRSERNKDMFWGFVQGLGVSACVVVHVYVFMCVYIYICIALYRYMCVSVCVYVYACLHAG